MIINILGVIFSVAVILGADLQRKPARWRVAGCLLLCWNGGLLLWGVIA